MAKKRLTNEQLEIFMERARGSERSYDTARLIDEIKDLSVALEANDKELAAVHAELRERESAQDELRRWSP